MAIIFMDSMAHYTTAAQGATKHASMNNAPGALNGAFSSPGTDTFTTNFTGSATIELSAYLYNVTASTQLLTFGDTDGTHVRMETMADGAVRFYNNASATLSTTAANVWQYNVHHHVYVKVVISNTVGIDRARVDGTSIISASGLDTLTSTSALITRMTFSATAWSHIAIANVSGDITGQPRVQALFPDGVGALSEWTPTAGANYTNVDETTPNDETDYVLSSTVGNRDLYTYSNALASTVTILAVAVVPRVRKTDAAVHEIAAMVRTGATNYVGATKAVPASYAYLQTVWQTNPNTAVAWTPAEVNAIEAGIQVIT